MMMTPKTRWVLTAVAAEVIVVASFYGYERLALHAARNHLTQRAAPRAAPDDPWQKVTILGIERPPAVRAELAALAGDEDVIGVETGGRARAYRLKALAERSGHVVNDLVGGVPVSVTYCDLSDCVRVYTDPTASAPLDVGAAGLYRGSEMVVKLGGGYFLQKSGTPVEAGPSRPTTPFATLPAVRTTWDEWRRRHPDTDVYEGPRTEP